MGYGATFHNLWNPNYNLFELFPFDITKILCGLPKTTQDQILDLIFTVLFLSVGKYN